MHSHCVDSFEGLYGDVDEGGVAVNCEKTQIFLNTLYLIIFFVVRVTTVQNGCHQKENAEPQGKLFIYLLGYLCPSVRPFVITYDIIVSSLAFNYIFPFSLNSFQRLLFS